MAAALERGAKRQPPAASATSFVCVHPGDHGLECRDSWFRILMMRSELHVDDILSEPTSENLATGSSNRLKTVAKPQR